MLRRFFLVGLMSILPPGLEGSVVQLVIAGLFCILYLVLQLHAQPFRCERRLRRAGIVRVAHGPLLLVCRHQGWRPLPRRLRWKASFRLGFASSSISPLRSLASSPLRA